MIKKVMTISSGNFPFSNEFDREAVVAKLQIAKSHYRAISELPVLPQWAAQLDDEIIRRSIFGTAAIEGNPLNEQQVQEIIRSEIPPAAEHQADREIFNLKKAYDFLREARRAALEQTFLDLNEDLLIQMNNIITEGVEYEDHLPGMYRDHRASVGDKAHGGVYVPPKHKQDIKTLMAAFVEWINSEDIKAEDPFVRGVLAHYHFAAIHPFGQGNGRTARLIEALILSMSGIKYLPPMLSNFYYDHIDDYYRAFREVQKSKEHHMDGFLHFCLDALQESALNLRTTVYSFIRILIVNQHIDLLKKNKRISVRQHDLLKLMISGPIFRLTLRTMLTESPFVSLYRNCSEATARRDLKKLEMIGIIDKNNNEYTINLTTLG